ncbi:phage tail fiber protein [Buttiauxella gaviniae ATCC 51604]|uniref:Phage tail fiber protein n=2 Tax=Buttiauxella gaviniae TaxID=82990 RepID=A0A1B7HQT6_9ENTR|nr:phage tail fiber protein [Buttiauxella gaviniae ATCC 51604]
MLSDLAESNDQQDLVFAIGWADGDSVPTYDATGLNPDAVDGLVLPDDRTWYLFKGYVSDFPFDFQANTVVQTSATIQRNGQGQWVRKAQPTS